MFKTKHLGKGLPNHTHNGLAAIQVVSGCVDMSFATGEKFELHQGDVMCLCYKKESFGLV